MKIIGIIIIIFCLILNVFVGLFLFGSSLPATEDISGKILEEKKYDNYGFSLFIPKDFISQGPRIESNVLESFFVDTPEDDFDPFLQINIYGEVYEGDIESSDKYKNLSKTDFEKGDPSYEFKYHDGGIINNKNGVKLYYDVVSLKSEGKIITEKIITFYHKNNQIQIFWSDDESGFDTSVASFDEVVNSIKKY